MSITLRVDGDLDVAHVGRLRARIDEALAGVRSGDDVLIDVAAARTIDGGGMGALVHLHKRVRALGGSVRIANARGAVLETLRRLRLDGLFQVQEISAEPRSVAARFGAAPRRLVRIAGAARRRAS